MHNNATLNLNSRKKFNPIFVFNPSSLPDLKKKDPRT